MGTLRNYLRSTDSVFPWVLLLGLLAITARNAIDPDLWWHLRAGQWVLETGHIPHADPFSFTRAGHPWIAHEWLSEITFYEIWKHAGAAALIVFSALVTTSGFMVLYWRCPGRRHWAVAATVLGALASAPAWGSRPQMFTFVFASMLLWLIERGEERPWLLLWIPAMFALWVNLHGGFAIGLALLFARSAGLLWEVASGEAGWLDVRPNVRRLLAVSVACMGLVPFNPGGPQLYRYPLEVVRSAGMRTFIVEWFPPDFHLARYGAFLCLSLALVVAFALTDRRPKARTLLPLLGALLAALDAVRHIPIFALLAVPVVAQTLPQNTIRPLPFLERPPSPWKLHYVFRGLVVLLMAVFMTLRWVSLIRNQDGAEAASFPRKALASLRSRGDTGELFAYYDWGGYAIWKLFPEFRVFVDGRADLYGDDLLGQFKTAVQLRPGWQEILETWRIRWVLVPPTTALAQALPLMPGWHEEYRDNQAVLFHWSDSPHDTEAQSTSTIGFTEIASCRKNVYQADLNLRN